MSINQSRTYKTLRNSGVAIVLFIVELVLNFISRKVFLDCLGTEILGINTTAKSILQCLNLVELGIGSAIAVTLYKPLLNDDKSAIKEIVALQGWFYKKVAFVVICLSALVMAFFPFIFAKSNLPLWYAYSTFITFLYSSLLGYFVNYKQVVLSADQQDYKIQLTFRLPNLVKVLVQTILIFRFRSNGYIIWIVCEICFSTLCAFLLQKSVNHSFPYLNTSTDAGRALASKYPEVLQKVKQLFFHKFGAFALSQTSPLIIYAYTTLSLVTLYGNYQIITAGLFALLNAVFNSIGAGIGNLVAENNKERIMLVFRELFSSRFWLVSTISFCLFYLCDPFISLWVGEQYLLDKVTVVLIVIIFFINTSRRVVDDYLAAYGLFKDIWAPIVEASLNIGLSILFGHFWGIHGILLGVIVSLVVVILIWKPYFLFTNALSTSVLLYVKLYLKHILLLVVAWVIEWQLIKFFRINPSDSYFSFVLYAILLMGSFALIEFFLLYLFEQGTRDFYNRMTGFLKIKRR